MPEPRIRRSSSGRSSSVDKRAFVRSDAFHKKADFAISEVLSHRNTTPLYELLAVFERTQYFKPLVSYFRDRAGVWPERDPFDLNNRVILRLGAPARGTLPSFAKYLEGKKGSIKDVLGPQARMTHVSHADALNKRLPGSYESGRKR